MVYFKSPKGDIIEVTEIHAEQVLRPQGKYIEVDKPVQKKVEVVKEKVSKKKTKR